MTEQSANLKFQDRSIHYDDGTSYQRWIAGPYQVVAYDHVDEVTGSRGVFYRAYVAVEPLGADGVPGHVDNVRVFDKPTASLDAAIAACQQHANSAQEAV